MSGTMHNGHALKNLFKEQNVSVTKMVELSGRNRTQIHNDFNRVTLKDEVIETYARALNRTVDELKMSFIEEKTDPSNYLLKQLHAIEEQFKSLVQIVEHQKQQLEVKDEQLFSRDKQIEKLIDILGKHKDVTQFETTHEKVLNSLKLAEAA